jgi:CheY-like chemotaxis protein
VPADPPRTTSRILLVEDDPGDVLIITEALEQAHLDHELFTVSDGDAALDYLYRRPPFEAAPRPDLVMLDLNLPRRSGREVLAEVKAHQGLRSIPIVVLTTSEAEEDIVRAYYLHANAYVPKPVDFAEFVRVINQIDDFYLSVARLPSRPDRR